MLRLSAWNAYHVRTFFSFDSNLNEHQCEINETVIMETASLIKSLGLAVLTTHTCYDVVAKL